MHHFITKCLYFTAMQSIIVLTFRLNTFTRHYLLNNLLLSVMMFSIWINNWLAQQQVDNNLANYECARGTSISPDSAEFLSSPANEVRGKVMFYTCVSFCSQGGGSAVCPTPGCRRRPPGVGQTPLDADPTGLGRPPWMQTPPGVGQTPPPDADLPPGLGRPP